MERFHQVAVSEDAQSNTLPPGPRSAYWLEWLSAGLNLMASHLLRTLVVSTFYVDEKHTVPKIKLQGLSAARPYASTVGAGVLRVSSNGFHSF